MAGPNFQNTATFSDESGITATALKATFIKMEKADRSLLADPTGNMDNRSTYIPFSQELKPGYTAVMVQLFTRTTSLHESLACKRLPVP